MARELVDQGGLLTLGSGPGLTDVMAGLDLVDATLERTVTTIDATASGDGYRSEVVVRRAYDLTATVYYAAAAPNLFAVGDVCWAAYRAQSTNAGGELSPILFAGQVVLARVTDRQALGQFETQQLTLRSTGMPSVG